MRGTSHLFDEFNCHGSASLTPVRDYKNDFFHKNDDRLPNLMRNASCRVEHLPKASSSFRQKGKRPASLVLDDSVAPLGKKQYSPLNLQTFNSTISLSETPDLGTINEEQVKFFDILEDFYNSELEYSEDLALANSVYRNVLLNDSSFRDKLLTIGSNEELLIFGNLDTMSSISKIFSTSIKSKLTISAPFINLDSVYWDVIKTDKDLQKKLYSSLDIGSLFEQHLLRIKSTYLSYYVSHEKQLELFQTIQTNHGELFKRWNDKCLRAAHYHKLEDILDIPIDRLNVWKNVLEELSNLSEGIIEPKLCQKLVETRNTFLVFFDRLENESLEYRTNSQYDFSLTPMEIIQSYGHAQIKGTDQEPLIPADYTHSNLDLPEINEETSETVSEMNSETPSFFSTSSSRYSENFTNTTEVQETPESYQPITKASLASLEPPKLKKLFGPRKSIITDISVPSTVITDTSVPFEELSTRFKKLFKNLIRLQQLFINEDFFLILDTNLQKMKSWKRVLECDSSSNEFLENRPLALGLYSSYIDKLHDQRGQLADLKLTNMRYKVLQPLTKLLELFKTVKTKLHDIQILKKDYTVYLKERKAGVHDVKREAIGKHFKLLQDEVHKELPLFISLVHKMTEMILLNYNQIKLQYFEILAGGQKYLQKDMIVVKSQENKEARNLDVLQTYSQSRYHTKRMVRTDWTLPGDPSSSRVVRKLFEL